MWIMGCSFENQFSYDVGTHEPSCCPNPNTVLIWNVTVDIVLELSDVGILHDLDVIHHLLAVKFLKQDERSPTEPSEKNSPSDWMEKRTCLVSSCGRIGRACLGLATA